MKNEKLLQAIGNIDDELVYGAVNDTKKKKKNNVWIKLGAMAACLCLVAAVAIPTMLYHQPESPNDMIDLGNGPASLVVNCTNYIISSHMAVTDELPAGFTKAGEAAVAGFEPCPYFTNPDVPEWVYVYQEVLTDGTVDATGTLNRTEPHDAYVRYVDERIRGKDIVCYNGNYYISMWSADVDGNYPDVSSEYYNTMESAYGIRIEGNVLDGFVSAGVAEFLGYDTIPSGMLTSNESASEIYANSDNQEVILVSTEWYTAPIGENGETNHSGYNVYIHYDCPLAP